MDKRYRIETTLHYPCKEEVFNGLRHKRDMLKRKGYENVWIVRNDALSRYELVYPYRGA
ncbi:MAG: hypothetical protein BIFFINMI_02385 [Phycisphaerae bacterium]|nr:hypothetical protein [Phycisphaerae bacterium]